MKKILVLPLGAAFFACFSLLCNAEEENTSSSFWNAVGQNIWYIVLAVLFAAGLIIIAKWSAKINARDREVKEEYEKWKSEHPEEAEAFENRGKLGTPESAITEDGEPETAEAEEETSNEEEPGEESSGL